MHKEHMSTSHALKKQHSVNTVMEQLAFESTRKQVKSNKGNGHDRYDNAIQKYFGAIATTTPTTVYLPIQILDKRFLPLDIKGLDCVIMRLKRNIYLKYIILLLNGTLLRTPNCLVNVL